MAELSVKEHCIRRLDGMKAARRGFEAEAKEIAKYTGPARSRFLASDTNKGRQPNKGLNNSHGIFAMRTLQGGMTSGLSSQSRPWFNLTTYDEQLSEDQEVKEWLGAVEQLMYGFLAKTNFYGAVKTGYLELGQFGTEACIMLEHLTEGAVCHQLTFGEYWLALGSAMTPEALGRECPMTVLQAVQYFGKENLSKRINGLWDRASYDEIVVFNQLIELNSEMNPDKLGKEGMPWRSVYWDAADDDQKRLTREQGFNEQPFWAPRWDTTGSDVWGQGPGHDALPDLRELQLQTKRKSEATDMLVWPEMVSSSKINLRRQPRSVVSAAEVDISKLVHVPYEVPQGVIGEIREDIAASEDKINQATYAGLFMAITNMQGIQPRNIEEIAARNEEKLTQLGPVIERVNNEKLEVAIERTFGIMQRGRLLPPAPEAMQGQPDLRIEFVSILTQMQRMVGLGQIERTVSFIGAQVATWPDALDKLDIDETIDEYASRAGMPPKLIRTAEMVEQIRADRAQQEQMQQMVAAAPAAKDGAEAAKLMSEVGQNGGLNQLMQGMSGGMAQMPPGMGMEEEPVEEAPYEGMDLPPEAMAGAA